MQIEYKSVDDVLENVEDIYTLPKCIIKFSFYLLLINNLLSWYGYC